MPLQLPPAFVLDSNVFISAAKGTERWSSQCLDCLEQVALGHARAYYNAVVRAEIQRVFSRTSASVSATERDKKVAAALRLLVPLATGAELGELAAAIAHQMDRRLRARGKFKDFSSLTCDGLIAATALTNDVPVVTLDGDFDIFFSWPFGGNRRRLRAFLIWRQP